MTRPVTSIDVQRIAFIESLHSSLKKQASQAIAEQKRYASLAKSYLEDGLDQNEAVELLMIDGLSREAAEGYASMVEGDVQDDNLHDYSFQYENNYGTLTSSYDIGKTVRAANDEEAWEKAQEVLENESVEAQKLLFVNRVS